MGQRREAIGTQHTSPYRSRAESGLAALALCCALIAGLSPAAAQGAAAKPAPKVVSPEVRHTGRGPTGYEVTFRYYAPKVAGVRIKGEWYFSDRAHGFNAAGYLPPDWKPGDFPIAYPASVSPNWPVFDMAPDPSTGIWSYTTPLPSGVFNYAFSVDCAAPAPELTGCAGHYDPANPPWNVPAKSPGSTDPMSQVFVPSDPAFGTVDYSWQFPNPVHGRFASVVYPTRLSANPPGSHALVIYTPPGYDPHRSVPYPTLYLSHGASGNEVEWSTRGVAGNIVDNLIAAGRVQPMVLVMTNFIGITGGDVGYARDVTENVIPYVEAHYHVSKNARDRAFGGLSLGGQRANTLLFNDTVAFGAYSLMSLAGSTPAATDPAWRNPALKALLGLQVGCGLFDPIVGSTEAETDLLASKGIPYTQDLIDGGHEWYVWRILLRDFVDSIAFKHTTTSLSRAAGAGLPELRAVTFVRATVTADTTEPAKPGGQVQFYLDGHREDPAVPLRRDGTARLALPHLSRGSHMVKAQYSGDRLYNPSTSEFTLTR